MTADQLDSKATAVFFLISAGSVVMTVQDIVVASFVLFKIKYEKKTVGWIVLVFVVLHVLRVLPVESCPP